MADERPVAEDNLQNRGHQVRVSDRNGVQLEAVMDQGDFPHRANREGFNPPLEQMHAAKGYTLPPDIQEDRKGILGANLIILQFPV
jgi:putative NADPH-quinone reductase